MNGFGTWAKRIGIGILAGLVGALVMTAVMALLRIGPGISPPAELLGDRIVPTLDVRHFIDLIVKYGGPNQLKQIPIKASIAGQLGVGVLFGLIYAFIVKEGKGQSLFRFGRLSLSRRGFVYISAVILVLWTATMIYLWPVLWSNYRGLPPTPARIVTMIGTFVSYASYGVTLLLAYHLLAGPFPIRETTPNDDRVRMGRRAVLVGGVGVVAAASGVGLIRALYNRGAFSYDGTRYHPADADYIVPVDRFYTVTKNLVDPVVEKPLWRLKIGGLVDHPHTYSFDDLTARTAVKQDTTLECISNGVGDGLMSNATWTGVPMRELLNDAGLKTGIKRVLLRAVDGYTDTIPLDKAMEPTTLVAYEMNGQPLPHHHGYPVRVIVPGRFGEKNVKWVTAIEPVGEEIKGYYEKQGWGPTFIPATNSRFDFPFNNQTLKLGSDTPVKARGVAFAGDRGISKVEVSFDDGKTWTAAQIDTRGSDLTWRLWNLAWTPAQPGDYHLWVRATDGTGEVQSKEHYDIVPDGASGFNRITVHIA